VLDQHRPLLHHSRCVHRAGRYHRQVDQQAAAL